MSLVATPPDGETGLVPGATVVPVDRLHVLHQVRAGGLDEAHVAALAELKGKWPPVLVWAEKPEAVIDGAHRLAAAQQLGYRTIAVARFHGSLEEAFVESVHRNVEHGLPLTLADRLRAGRRILRRHPDWSDRRIGEVCALAGGTIARARRELAAQSPAPIVAIDTRPGPASRIGRDGRVRPVRSAALRQRIMDALGENPRGSLREIAAAAGASPETVRRVRMGLNSTVGTHAPVPLRRARPDDGTSWHADAALASRAELGEFLEWFERTEPGDDPYRFVGSVPLSRVYEMADEARRRAAFWAELGRTFEERARGSAYLQA